MKSFDFPQDDTHIDTIYSRPRSDLAHLRQQRAEAQERKEEWERERETRMDKERLNKEWLLKYRLKAEYTKLINLEQLKVGDKRLVAEVELVNIYVGHRCKFVKECAFIGRADDGKLHWDCDNSGDTYFLGLSGEWRSCKSDHSHLSLSYYKPYIRALERLKP